MSTIAPPESPARTSAVAPDYRTVEPAGHSIPDLFQQQVGRRGPQPAMYFKAAGSWHGITWEQYGQVVKRVAGFLLLEGLKHGERAAILSYNRPEWHVADLAIQHVGGTVVGIYLTNSPPQCQYIIDHAEAPVVFVENRDQLRKLLEVKASLPAVRRVVLISGELETGDGDWVTTWEKAVEAGDAYNESHIGEFERRWREVGPTDIATFIYTSGTTGPPKAVMLDQGNLTWTVACIDKTLPLDRDDPSNDVTLSYLPLAHIAERMAGHFLHVYFGHRTYFAEDLSKLVPNVQEVRPTFMFGVPRIWEKYQQAVEGQVAKATGVKGVLGRWGLKTAMKNVDNLVAGNPPSVSYKLADRLVLSKVRAFLGFDRIKQLSTGAAPIGPKTLRFFWGLGLPLYEVYGESENTGPLSTNRQGYVHLGTVGPAMPGVELRLAEDGEVLARGGNIFRGYFKDEKATAETLVDGWLHTGDVGEIDAEGYLKITDRKKDLIITAGGKNISPSNLELLVKRAIPYAGQVVAIGDRRPFMSALVTIDPEQVKLLAQDVGEPPEMAALSKSEKVNALFQQRVDDVNKNLSNVEAIKKFTILPSDLSVDGGELTPTLKVKRKVVNEKYAKEIEAIYAGGGKE
jgi:long-subunit acyl-CoA synthetase (AMP-forming)